MTQRKQILIAEDESMMLKALQFRLMKGGYDAVTAPDGQKAMEMIESSTPDLIITDIMMPFVSGLEIVNSVKGNERYKHIPVIVLSAVGLENTVLEAFKLGADDFLTKPFSPNELSIRVRKLLA
jgi:DNA-binding response OmpR family regulator